MLKKILFSIIVLSAFLLGTSVIYGWSAPSSSFPFGKTIAPLNTTSLNQEIIGSLEIVGGMFESEGETILGGKTGINTENPSSALDIFGNVRVDGPEGELVSNQILFGIDQNTDNYFGFSDFVNFNDETPDLEKNYWTNEAEAQLVGDTCPDGDITNPYICQTGENTGSEGCRDIAKGTKDGDNAWFQQQVYCTSADDTGLLHKLTNINGTIKFLNNRDGDFLPNLIIGDDGKAGIGVDSQGIDTDARLTIGGNGILKTDGIKFNDGSEQTSAEGSLPEGTVSFFDNDGSYDSNNGCPAGWYNLNEHAGGRYVVGTVSGGTPGAMVGNSLSNLENRPAGNHQHNVSIKKHSHLYRYYGDEGTSVKNPNGNNGSPVDTTDGGKKMVSSKTWITLGSSKEYGATLDENNNSYSAIKDGTPAPYVQYNLCHKGEPYWDGTGKYNDNDIYPKSWILYKPYEPQTPLPDSAEDTCDGDVNNQHFCSTEFQSAYSCFDIKKESESLYVGRDLSCGENIATDWTSSQTFYSNSDLPKDSCPGSHEYKPYTCTGVETSNCYDVAVVPVPFFFDAYKTRKVTCAGSGDYGNWGNYKTIDPATVAPNTTEDICDGDVNNQYACGLYDEDSCLDIKRDTDGSEGDGWYKGTVVCNQPRLLPVDAEDNYGNYSCTSTAIPLPPDHDLMPYDSDYTSDLCPSGINGTYYEVARYSLGTGVCNSSEPFGIRIVTCSSYDD